LLFSKRSGLRRAPVTQAWEHHPAPIFIHKAPPSIVLLIAEVADNNQILFQGLTLDVWPSEEFKITIMENEE
jgi:hypothetical protein